MNPPREQCTKPNRKVPHFDANLVDSDGILRIKAPYPDRDEGCPPCEKFRPNVKKLVHGSLKTLATFNTGSEGQVKTIRLELGGKSEEKNAKEREKAAAKAEKKEEERKAAEEKLKVAEMEKQQQVTKTRKEKQREKKNAKRKEKKQQQKLQTIMAQLKELGKKSGQEPYMLMVDDNLVAKPVDYADIAGQFGATPFDRYKVEQTIREKHPQMLRKSVSSNNNEDEDDSLSIPSTKVYSPHDIGSTTSDAGNEYIGEQGVLIAQTLFDMQHANGQADASPSSKPSPFKFFPKDPQEISVHIERLVPAPHHPSTLVDPYGLLSEAPEELIMEGFKDIENVITNTNDTKAGIPYLITRENKQVVTKSLAPISSLTNKPLTFVDDVMYRSTQKMFFNTKNLKSVMPPFLSLEPSVSFGLDDKGYKSFFRITNQKLNRDQYLKERGIELPLMLHDVNFTHRGENVPYLIVDSTGEDIVMGGMDINGRPKWTVAPVDDEGTFEDAKGEESLVIEGKSVEDDTEDEMELHGPVVEDKHESVKPEKLTSIIEEKFDTEINNNKDYQVSTVDELYLPGAMIEKEIQVTGIEERGALDADTTFDGVEEELVEYMSVRDESVDDSKSNDNHLVEGKLEANGKSGKEQTCDS